MFAAQLRKHDNRHYPASSVTTHPILFGVTLFLLSHSLLALPEDSKLPLLVSADSADSKQKQHLGVYLGHVAVDQGSTHIRAAKATTKGDDQNHLLRAVIEGDNVSQAHYWTLQQLVKPEFHAYADTISYYPMKHQILLVGHASVIQDQNKITATTICYNTLTQEVTTSFSGEQTVISIHPSGEHSLELHQ